MTFHSHAKRTPTSRLALVRREHCQVPHVWATPRRMKQADGCGPPHSLPRHVGPAGRVTLYLTKTARFSSLRPSARDLLGDFRAS